MDVSAHSVPFAIVPADVQARMVEDQARRIVQNEVCYCVSALVSAMIATATSDNSAAIMTDDDCIALARRQPDADDYREAAREAGLFDAPLKPAAHGLSRIDVSQGDGVWRYSLTDDDGDEIDAGQGYDDTEAGAWRIAFDNAGIDHPDGADCYEHWLVTDWLADKLEAHGEAVARDVAGLTIWGRCTSGQAIYADAIIQTIAREVMEA